jgi:hypothetical protein
MAAALAFLYGAARRSLSIAYADGRDSASAVDGKAVLTIAGASAQPASLMTVDPLPTDALGLVHCLDLAGVSHRDLVLVSGPGSLPAMLWLCRQGYERAVHLHPGSPRCGAEPADALFVPHLPEACELTSVLPAGGWVREGGVLILRLAGRFDSGACVASLGALDDYELERRFLDKGHAVLVARHLSHAQGKAA